MNFAVSTVHAGLGFPEFYGHRFCRGKDKARVLVASPTIARGVFVAGSGFCVGWCPAGGVQSLVLGVSD